MGFDMNTQSIVDGQMSTGFDLFYTLIRPFDFDSAFRAVDSIKSKNGPPPIKANLFSIFYKYMYLSVLCASEVGKK